MASPAPACPPPQLPGPTGVRPECRRPRGLVREDHGSPVPTARPRHPGLQQTPLPISSGSWEPGPGLRRGWRHRRERAAAEQSRRPTDVVPGTALEAQQHGQLFPRGAHPHPRHCCGSGCRPPLGPAHEAHGQKSCGRPGLSANGPSRRCSKAPRTLSAPPRPQGGLRFERMCPRECRPGPSTPRPPLPPHLGPSSGSWPPRGLGSPGCGHSCARRPGQVAGFLGQGTGTAQEAARAEAGPPRDPSSEPLPPPGPLSPLGRETVGAARAWPQLTWHPTLGQSWWRELQVGRVAPRPGRLGRIPLFRAGPLPPPSL